MDRFEATRAIRRLLAPGPPIVALAAQALAGERERCLQAGMDHYMTKPFLQVQMHAIVERWRRAPR